MTTLEELIIRYGVIAHRRFYEREKRRFLMIVGKEFQALGYQVEAKVAKNGQFKGYNLYIGDIKKANTIVTAYYDTPMKTFGWSPYRVLSKRGKGMPHFLATFLPVTLVVALSIFFFQSIVTPHWSNDGITYAKVLIVVAMLILLKVTISCKQGIGNRSNMVRNTSSILTLIKFAQVCKTNEKVAFALTDFGCVNYFGEEMLKQYLGKGWENKKFIMLDSIGNKDAFVLLASTSFKHVVTNFKQKFSDVELTVKDLDDEDAKQMKVYKHNLVITSGIVEDGEVIIKSVNTSQDKEINLEKINLTVSLLAELI